jgi:colanic acid/amylovoran biosynthesis glycosyltransferase
MWKSRGQELREPPVFKLGYVAFHAYRLTFEINEIVEILRRRPDTRVYSFYRPRGAIQQDRVREVPAEIMSWSLRGMLSGLAYFCARSPGRLAGAAAALAWESKSNPVYWVKNGFVFLAALPLLADARRHGVTHLHADFGASSATIAWIGSRLLGTGFSIRYHSFDIHDNRLGWRDPLRRRKLGDADLVVVVHRDGIAHLRWGAPDVDPGKFRMIRISVAFQPLPKPERLPEPPLVLAAGNFVAAKGFDVLARSAAVLAERKIAFRMRILGDGPERGRIRAIGRANGMEERIELPGFYRHGDFPQHLAEAAVLVVPARITRTGLREGLPTVIPEAWLSRTPVIAAPVGGIPEVVVDGETGLLFAAENERALADAIARLLASDELRARLAQNGYDCAIAEFSPEKNVGELLGEIESRTRPRGRFPSLPGGGTPAAGARS